MRAMARFRNCERSQGSAVFRPIQDFLNLLSLVVLLGDLSAQSFTRLSATRQESKAEVAEYDQHDRQKDQYAQSQSERSRNRRTSW